MLKKEIDLAPLRASQRFVELTETIELPPVGGLEFPMPVAVRLVIERLGSELIIQGTADVTVAGDCDRCLGRFKARRTYEIDESFSIASAGGPFDEGNVVHDEQLDLTEFIRQVVDAALPLVTVCKVDCEGLCPACGSNLNEGTCDCGLRMKGDHGKPEMEDPSLQNP